MTSQPKPAPENTAPTAFQQPSEAQAATPRQQQAPLLPLPPHCRIGAFVLRRKRFSVLLRVEAPDGAADLWAHSNNSGSMLGLTRPGAPVLVSPASNPARKLKYTQECVWLAQHARPAPCPTPGPTAAPTVESQAATNPAATNQAAASHAAAGQTAEASTAETRHAPSAAATAPKTAPQLTAEQTATQQMAAAQMTTALGPGFWVGVNTSVPNRMLEAAFTAGRLPFAQGYTHLVREAKRGQSRLDGLLTGPNLPPLWVECKNVTMVEDNAACFPDAASERGQKHLRELMDVVANGERGAMFYLVQRPDGACFAPADFIDPTYAALFYAALRAGVEMYPFRAVVSSAGVDLGDPLPVRPDVDDAPGR